MSIPKMVEVEEKAVEEQAEEVLEEVMEVVLEEELEAVLEEELELEQVEELEPELELEQVQVLFIVEEEVGRGKYVQVLELDQDQEQWCTACQTF